MVDTGAGDPVQVVCGAPNARAGMTGVFVPPGAYIPGKDMTLGVGKSAASKAAGCWSPNSSCKISDDHEGNSSTCRPMPSRRQTTRNGAGLDDPVIEINLTPNRADCTGVQRHRTRPAAADMGKLQECADQGG